MTQASTRGARPGERRGGRSRGVPNKKTIGRRMALLAAGASPELAAQPPRLQPLTLMLDVMNDASLPLEMRLTAARWAAPYVHHHKGQVDTGDISRPLMIQVVRFSDGAQLTTPRSVFDMGKLVEVDMAEAAATGE
jgi:hypothetical protein